MHSLRTYRHDTALRYIVRVYVHVAMTSWHGDVTSVEKKRALAGSYLIATVSVLNTILSSVMMSVRLTENRKARVCDTTAFAKKNSEKENDN